MRKLTKLFYVFIFLITTFSQAQQLSPSAQISVLTCGKGNELYSLFGHTALRIDDPVTGVDRVYNYGTFDFATPNFALKFVKGDLQYFVSVSNFREFLYNYNYEERSVLEQVLDVPQEKKQELFSRLNQSLNSSDRFYTYKFIDKNCTTKVMDILNEVLGEKSIQKVGNTQESYRDIIYPEFKNHFFEQWGTSLFFGTKVDKPAEAIFLPIELWTSLNEAKFSGKTLLKSNQSLLHFEETPETFSIWNNVFVYVFILGIVLFWRKKSVVITYFIVLGILGLIFVGCGWYSLHTELQWNYNAFLINPFLLVLAIAMIRNHHQSVFYLSAINLLCLILYLGCMIGKIHFLIVLPMIVVNAILLITLTLQSRKKLSKIKA